jgi:ribonuclease HI
MTESTLIIHTDGGARGNPGPAGVGVVITTNDKVLLSVSKFLGIQTNNVAEYTALKIALELIIEKNFNSSEIQCCSDSELMVKQLNGLYKIKDLKLQALALEVKNLMATIIKQGSQISIIHIPRNLNQQADKLANQAMDLAV